MTANDAEFGSRGLIEATLKVYLMIHEVQSALHDSYRKIWKI